MIKYYQFLDSDRTVFITGTTLEVQFLIGKERLFGQGYSDTTPHTVFRKAKAAFEIRSGFKAFGRQSPRIQSTASSYQFKEVMFDHEQFLKLSSMNVAYILVGDIDGAKRISKIFNMEVTIPLSSTYPMFLALNGDKGFITKHVTKGQRFALIEDTQILDLPPHIELVIMNGEIVFVEGGDYGES